ncbi:class I SAM-dependent methyltransferase [Paenibacillus spongiae]|uniref:Class I SAM-dependent methyltransferase n=1 Tax=Paenibacillus spongiae TaxID=2909671 RepID=A0ABY5SEL0_9BACL|nr:class I SAM-dependent methyltransferase [Paenibacillus spongiae]UVI31925.1 class I SAM-dependent methyltransferase [Paenibacillus spongiae]
MKQAYEQVGVAMTCRSYEEYMRMFDLREEEVAQGETLDIAGGGSSFTAEARTRGYAAYAVDPRYKGSFEGWVAEAEAEIETSTAKLAGLAEHYDWTYYGDLERHRAGRVASLQQFASHAQDASGREFYIPGSLPSLPFDDRRFDLVLCSHFLFLYADQFDKQFHLDAVLEMMRVSRKAVLIYPLISLRLDPYPHMEHIMDEIRKHEGRPELFRSQLPFIPGSIHGLKINL